MQHARVSTGIFFNLLNLLYSQQLGILVRSCLIEELGLYQEDVAFDMFKIKLSLFESFI